MYDINTPSPYLTSTINTSFPHYTQQVEPGDGVRFRDFAGSDVKLEGIEYRVVRGYDILAKWKQ